MATIGRRRSNATFRESHAVDALEQAWLAMDLGPLVRGEDLDVVAYVDSLLGRFGDDVRARLKRHANPTGGE